MRKYISLAVTVFFFLPVHAQPGAAIISTEVKTKGHRVTRLAPVKRISFTIPKAGVLHEFHEGSRLFSAVSKRSKLNGGWQSWYATGHSCDSGKLVNNLPDGEWRYWDEEGRLIAVRTYSAEKFNRVSEEIQRYHPKRSFFTLAALSQQNREAAHYYLSSAYSFPAQPNSHFTSLRELVHSNTGGTTAYRPVFEDCLHEGLFMNLFANGQAKDSGYYKDGLRDGHWLHRDAAGGHYWTGAYKDGKKVKEWKLYSHQGKLKEIVTWQKGEITWRKAYNK